MMIARQVIYFERERMKMKVNSMEVPFVDDETCENMKPVLSKYGQMVVCDDDEEKVPPGAIVLPGGDGCETAKEVVSKYGVQVVCEEEDEKK